MKDKRDIKSSFVRYAAVATALFAIFLFVKKDNVIRWIQAGFTIRKQERQIELLKQQNSELEGKIRIMSSNRDSLETYAREQFQFVRNGDDLFLTE